MKKLMMIGKVGCGKTTLTQYLNNKELSYKKTQALEIVGDVIDTPGEYVERRSYYQALAVTSVDVDVVLLLVFLIKTLWAIIRGKGFALLTQNYDWTTLLKPNS